MPKVSVIMGIYNCAATLDQAIESILAQTFTDWEMIMCDDGSCDDTYNVARKYVEYYPDKFILLKNETNQGLNKTLNNCLQAASGEYIARMDGDDVSLPERFATEVAFFDENPQYAIVSTPMIFFDEKGVWKTGRTTVREPKISDFVFHAPFHCHAPCMIRKAAFDVVCGYTVDTRLLRYEDCNLWYKLYTAGYRGYNLDEPLYMMRDDRNAYCRRTPESRMRAVYVQWVGFRMIKMPIKYYPYLIIELLKSLAVVLMPEKIYNLYHKR